MFSDFKYFENSYFNKKGHISLYIYEYICKHIEQPFLFELGIITGVVTFSTPSGNTKPSYNYRMHQNA